MSYGSSYASATDFTNWKSTNRFTIGLGYIVDKFSVDLAYQYSTQKGEFYPFSAMSVNDGGQTYANVPTMTKVQNDRSQLLMTVGYHF